VETGEALVSALVASRSAFCCGGAALAIPIGGVRIYVCVVVVEVFVRVSCAVLSGGLEANDALVSALASGAASFSALRFGVAVVVVPVRDDEALECMGRNLVCVSSIVLRGGLRIKEPSVSVLAVSAASRSAFCCRMILSTNWVKKNEQVSHLEMIKGGRRSTIISPLFEDLQIRREDGHE